MQYATPEDMILVNALRLAVPFALASWIEDDSLARCVEASVCAAEALKRMFRLQARAVPCAVVVVKDDRTNCIGLGLNAEEIRRLFDESAIVIDQTEHREKYPFHVVLEIQFQATRAMVDLTIAQLRRPFGVNVPATAIYFGDGWPSYKVQDWSLYYIDSPHAIETDKVIARYSHLGLTRDIEALLFTALACGADANLFFSTLSATQPAVYSSALAKLTRCGELGSL